MPTDPPFATADSEFWLPNLCAPLALLRLLLLSVGLSGLLILLRAGLGGLDLLQAGALFLYATWILLFAAAGLCLLRRWGAAWPLAGTASLALLWVAVAASVCALLAYRWVPALLPGTAGGMLIFWGETVLVASMVGAVLLRLLYVQRALQRQQGRLMQAQFAALQARSRPHFLFNSLNSIAALLRTDAARAEEALLNLSDILRATLQTRASVSLAAELALCRKYLAIEQLRMGERLRLAIEVEAGLEDLPVPALSLQPLLENAVLHGVQQLPEGGCLRLAIARDPRRGEVRICVENPLPEQPLPSTGSQTALDNTRARFAALYPAGFRFQAAAAGGQFRVLITLRWAP
ncbi:MAG: histidine kinase [Cellvibrionales bacterium]|nr:histidine kinase [Cellvibrionales bacterium]